MPAANGIAHGREPRPFQLLEVGTRQPAACLDLDHHQPKTSVCATSTPHHHHKPTAPPREAGHRQNKKPLSQAYLATQPIHSQAARLASPRSRFRALFEDRRWPKPTIGSLANFPSLHITQSHLPLCLCVLVLGFAEVPKSSRL